MSRLKTSILTSLLLMVVGACNLQDDAPPTSLSDDVALDSTPERDASSADTSDDATATPDAEDAAGQSDADRPDAEDDAGQPDADRPDAEDATDDAGACAADLERCGVDCVDTQTALDHCGACDNACPPLPSAQLDGCSAGQCAYTCQSGFFDLNADLGQDGSDGCEATCQPSNGGQETCDGVDNNCDGTVDEGCACSPGATRACGQDTGACELGSQECSAQGQWGACTGSVGPRPERCDGLDNNCDGKVDETFPEKGSACATGLGACRRTGDFICNAAQDGVVCDASAGSPSTEVCDGVDNDCDGTVDGITRACGTNTGECSTGTETCSAGNWGSCQGSVGPSTEVCDGADNNCDGDVDEGTTTEFFLDVDDDGWGVTGDSQQLCSASGDYRATQVGDCDDGSSVIYPDANESCNTNVDFDCDGVTGCADDDCNNGDTCQSGASLGTCSGNTCDTSPTCFVTCQPGDDCICGGTQCCPFGQSCQCF